MLFINQESKPITCILSHHNRVTLPSGHRELRINFKSWRTQALISNNFFRMLSEVKLFWEARHEIKVNELQSSKKADIRPRSGSRRHNAFPIFNTWYSQHDTTTHSAWDGSEKCLIFFNPSICRFSYVKVAREFLPIGDFHGWLIPSSCNKEGNAATTRWTRFLECFWRKLKLRSRYQTLVTWCAVIIYNWTKEFL